MHSCKLYNKPHTDPQRPTRLFLDTEFSRFGMPGRGGAKLISLGLVDESGQHAFYVETSGWQISDCSDFVIQTVIPLLSAQKIPVCDAAQQLRRYLAQFDYAVIHCDYQGDWDWLAWMLEQDSAPQEWPSALHHAPHLVSVSEWVRVARNAASEAMAEWFKSVEQHHAGNDAQALRYAWIKARESLGWVEDPGSVVDCHS